jgi:hypothetical protein
VPSRGVWSSVPSRGVAKQASPRSSRSPSLVRSLAAGGSAPPSAHETATDQPSASRRPVTVLGVPSLASTGRDQWTGPVDGTSGRRGARAWTAPGTRYRAARRCQSALPIRLPIRCAGERLGAIPALEAGEPGLLSTPSSLLPRRAGAGGRTPGRSCPAARARRAARGCGGRHSPGTRPGARIVFNSASCSVARERDAAALPGGAALFQGRVVARAAAAAPEHLLQLQLQLQRPLLTRCRTQLLRIGLPQIAHRLHR